MTAVVDLSSLKPGSKAVVVAVEAGYGLRNRLYQMGLTPGTEVEVAGVIGGNIEVKFRGTTAVLSRGIAKKILVSPVQL
mgnify:CR=1 FL=1